MEVNKRIGEAKFNQMGDINANAIIAEVNSWDFFPDTEDRHCIALLRILHRAVVCPGA
jgi:hypothetical protein